MNAHNDAIRLAQQVIRKAADQMPQQMGERGGVEHRDVSGMRRAALLIDSLILPESEVTR